MEGKGTGWRVFWGDYMGATADVTTTAGHDAQVEILIRTGGTWSSILIF